MSALDIQVVIDCANPAALAEFWADALEYIVEPPPPGFGSWEQFAEQIGLPPEDRDRLAAVVDRDRSKPRILFQKVPEPKTIKNRVHLDIDVAPNIAGGSDDRKARARTRAQLLAERSVATRDAPLLVVVLVVSSVVVPATAVRLEDRLRSGECEVEVVRAAVSPQWELAHEVGDAMRDEEPSHLHLERRPRGMYRVELVEQPAHRSDAQAPTSPETIEVRTQRGDRGEAAPASILARDLERLLPRR